MMTQIQENKFLQFALLVVIFFVLCAIVPQTEGNWLWRLPPYIAQLPLIINNSVEFIMFDWWPIQVYDPEIEDYEEKAMMSEFTRAASSVILFMIEFIREIFLGGQKTIVTFTSWDYVSENEWARLPGLPWTVIAGGAAILGYALNGPRLAIFVGFELITKVPPTLHTPLMSGSNAISGITIVGALLSSGMGEMTISTILGMVALVFATINVVGGYMVTDRMLKMFKKK